MSAPSLSSASSYDQAIEMAKQFADAKTAIPPECQRSMEACIERVCKDNSQISDTNVGGFWGHYTAAASRTAALPKGALNFAIATFFKDSLCKGPTRPSSPAIPVAHPAPIPIPAPAASSCVRSQVSTHGWVMGGLILVTIAAIRIVEITAPETAPTAESAIQSLYIWMGIESEPANRSYYPDGA